MSTELIKLVLDDAGEKMVKAVEHARKEFSGIRTGRAAPALVEKIPVEYYGSEVPLQQIAGFQVPEARMLVISPYDKSALGAIEKALQHSDLGLNPSNDGQIIRVVIPQLSEERRREMVKVALGKGEAARVTIRNIRRKAMEELHRIARDGEAGEDEVGRAEKELDATTKKYVDTIDDLLKGKETELLEV